MQTEEPSEALESLVPAADGARCFCLSSVIKTDPGRWHTVRSHVADSRKLKLKEVLVAFHRHLNCGPSGPVLSMRGGTREGLSSVMTGFTKADMASIRNEFLVHKQVPDVRYALKDFVSEDIALASAVTNELVKARAFPGSSCDKLVTMGVPETECLRRMASAGFVEDVQHANGSGFGFTKKRIGCLGLRHIVGVGAETCTSPSRRCY